MRTIVFIALLVLTMPVMAAAEEPVALPKAEGSRSFDMEVDELNNSGIVLYRKNDYQRAGETFKRALTLARQLRDPGVGILYFNYALTLHRLERHEEATENFYSARRYARGNEQILNSETFKRHECGYNPSVACETPPPASMNIEGSD